MKNSYVLQLPTGKLKQASRIWLYLAIFALTIAGLFSLPPVFLRKSSFADVNKLDEIFTTALIIHVNMSVLVWLLAVSCMIWSLAVKKQLSIFNISAPITAFAGAVLIAISPLIGESEPLKNNYIPVLVNDCFFIGLGVFASGIVIQIVLTLSNFKSLRRKNNAYAAQNFGIYVAALVMLTALTCFGLSRWQIDKLELNFLYPEQYYETLFWAGGHVMQFVFVQMMVLAWLWLAETNKMKILISQKQLIVIYCFLVVLMLPTPILYTVFTVDSGYFNQFFTMRMKYAGGIVPILVGMAILFAIPHMKRQKDKFIPRSCLFLSMILFFIGGIIGFIISGNDAQVPAHYHGSIVAVTIAFMGIIYDLLPKFGYAKLKGFTANSQPIIYGFGQMMHVLGLAIMGGYGALRKAPGTSDQVQTIIGKSLFFSGGALAILGGFLFVVVVVRSMTRK